MSPIKVKRNKIHFNFQTPMFKINAKVTKKRSRLSVKVTAVEINLHERTIMPPFEMACYWKTQCSPNSHKGIQEFKQ